MRQIKSVSALTLGVTIGIADVYWTYTSYFDTLWLALGVLILVADIGWIGLDLSLMRGEPGKKVISKPISK